MGASCMGWSDHIELSPYVPSSYIVRKRVQVGRAFVLKVWYREATNCDGNKILVYKGFYRDFIKEKPDPYFQEESGPVARFHPSQEGWEHALKFARTL